MKKSLLPLLLFLAGCTLPPTQEQKYDMMVRPVAKVFTASGTSGSGVVFYSRDYTLIISANHVTRGQEELKVFLNGELYSAELVKESEKLDLSILRVEIYTNFVAHIHNKASLKTKTFERIFVVGAGRGYLPYPAMGIISNPQNGKHKLIQFSAPTVGGNSGGAVYRRHEEHFELVGIVVKEGIQPVSVSPDITIKVPISNVGFAIPIQTVNDFIKEVL